MGSFSTWRAGFIKKPSVRQVTYICGSEPVLQQAVVQSIKSFLGVDPWNYAVYVAGDDSDRSIWAEADQHPMGEGKHLVIVHHAERLTSWDRFTDWVSHRSLNPRTHLILIADLERLPRNEVTPEQRRHGERPELVPYLASLREKAHLIECRPYTTDTAEQAKAWVRDQVEMRDGVAGHLLNRANGDLRLVRDVCRKLALFPSEPTLSVVNEMLAQRARDTFVDALLALDKPTALLALESLSPEQYSTTIGMLDHRLDLAGQLHDMQLSHHTPAEMARAVGNQGFLVRDVLPVAKHYDRQRLLTIRKMLAVADDALRGGVTTAVVEAVVALW